MFFFNYDTHVENTAKNLPNASIFLLKIAITKSFFSALVRSEIYTLSD